MLFQTRVDIPSADVKIVPCQRMLFVGSCFADNIGQRFQKEKFRAEVNPFGVMYNPASVVHTVEKWSAGHTAEFAKQCDRLFAVITLGTNHVYREKATGQIVDNCQKRPQSLFQEETLSVDECYDYLRQAVEMLFRWTGNACQPSVERPLQVIITVSPIRYRKYGYHESQLSKATLLLAADRLTKALPAVVSYFPAYEILNDELRDYRFYQPDMLHPSEQAVEYVYERFAETYFSEAAYQFLAEWRPLKDAFGHRAFNADSEEYKAFMTKTKAKLEALKQKYPEME